MKNWKALVAVLFAWASFGTSRSTRTPCVRGFARAPGRRLPWFVRRQRTTITLHSKECPRVPDAALSHSLTQT
jgi:hypothetical protein